MARQPCSKQGSQNDTLSNFFIRRSPARSSSPAWSYQRRRRPAIPLEVKRLIARKRDRARRDARNRDARQGSAHES